MNSERTCIHLAVLRAAGRWLEQGHTLGFVVPQEGGVVHPSPPRDGLCVAPKLVRTEYVICMMLVGEEERNKLRW